MFSSKPRVLGAIALVLVVFAAYSPALRAGYLWDDTDYVVHNANLTRPDGWHRIWFAPRQMVQYYPLVHSALRVEHHFWQLQPAGYHAVNILLQALNALFLWMILRRLAVPGSGWIAAIWAVHPLQVESVAWITEIKNLLSGCFYFLAVLAFLRFRAAQTDETSTPARANRGGKGVTGTAQRPALFYGLSLGLFLLALLSKTTAVTLPVVLLVLVWWKSPRLKRRDIVPLVPMFALAAALGAFTWWLETFHVGSENVLSLSIWDRILIPGRVAWFYAGKLLWPAPLSFIYRRWQADPAVWWQFLFPLATIGAVVWLWIRRHRWGKGPLAAVLFYLITLAPVSGWMRFYFQLYSFVGDHFQYMAGIGLIAAIVAPIARGLEQRQRKPAFAAVRRFAPPAVVLALAVLTWNRAQAYHTEEALWRDTIAKNPTAWIAHNNLGVVCNQQGRKSEAAGHFQAAIRYNPNSPEAHANLGVWFQGQGDADRAIDEYRKCIALKPQLYDTQYNLGLLLLQRGELEEAAQRFTDAVHYRPQMADAHLMLGDVLVAQQQLQPAIAEYRAALAINPAMANAYTRLGWVYTNLGAFGDARTALHDAVRLNPADAHAQALLGFVFEKTGDPAGASRQYQLALQMNPQVDIAIEGLARLSQPRP